MPSKKQPKSPLAIMTKLKSWMELQIQQLDTIEQVHDLVAQTNKITSQRGAALQKLTTAKYKNDDPQVEKLKEDTEKLGKQATQIADLATATGKNPKQQEQLIIDAGTEMLALTQHTTAIQEAVTSATAAIASIEKAGSSAEAFNLGARVSITSEKMPRCN